MTRSKRKSARTGPQRRSTEEDRQSNGRGVEIVSWASQRSNEDPSVNFVWLANSILGMAKTDWKADVHSHGIY